MERGGNLQSINIRLELASWISFAYMGLFFSTSSGHPREIKGS